MFITFSQNSNLVQNFKSLSLKLVQRSKDVRFNVLAPSYVKNNLTKKEPKFQLHSSTQLDTSMLMKLQIHNMNTLE